VIKKGKGQFEVGSDKRTSSFGSGCNSGTGHKGGSGGSHNRTTVTSKESFDEFMQQIQHDVKMANEDPEKEFKVLEGKIMILAKKKVGSKFLQDHLSKSKQILINKIID